MSEILIKNVEMPMHCAMCGFHGAMSDPMISQHFCKVTGVRILNPYKGRLDDCPLIEVPEPHGRLISADELIEFIENRYEITWKDDYEGGIKDACIDVLEKISTMPTVIPASEET